MQTRKGIPVSPGVAISRAVVLDTDEEAVPRSMVPADGVQAEHQLLDEAIAASVEELKELHAHTVAVLGDTAIFSGTEPIAIRSFGVMASASCCVSGVAGRG